MRRPLLVLALPATIALALTGCSSGAGSSSSAAGVGAPMSGEGGSTSSGQAAQGGGKPSAGGAPAAGTGSTPLQRSVVRTGSLTVAVGDVAVAAQRAAEAARTAGGEVEQEDSSGTGAEARATLRLRVPGPRLDPLVSRIAALGSERDRQLQAEDVTDQAVDLDSRLATQRRSVARVQALLDRAGSLGDVVRIEGELASREAELESVEARRAALRGQTDLATLTVQLQPAGPGPVKAAGPAGFGDGLNGGWRALVASARVVALTAGALLPFLPLLAVGGLLGRRLLRRPGAQARPPVPTESL